MVDIPKRQAAELEKLLKQVRALIKGLKYCEVSHGSMEPEADPQAKLYWIEIKSPYQFAMDLRDLVNACPNFVHLEHHEFPGSYDWASDTYFKDTSAVKFAIN